MDKLLQRSLYYDFYAELLTEKQRNTFKMYYLDDFSLQEVAEQNGGTRQAVNLLLKRTEKILEGYETKLHLVEKHMLKQDKVNAVGKLVVHTEHEMQIRELLNEILQL